MRNDVFTRRNELIGKVQVGELTPSDAEDLAEAEELGPFATTPSTERFDPMSLDGWTLPMTLAWIGWRTSKQVRQYWNDYRDACVDWRFQSSRVGLDGEVTEGHFLERRSRATVQSLRFDVLMDLGFDDPPFLRKSIDDASNELWAMLTIGAISATGFDLSTGERVAIPPAAWHDLKIVESEGRDALAAREGFPANRFDRVLVNGAQVRQLWLPQFDRAGVEPPLLAPEGDVFTPLSRVAHWIATLGGEKTAPSITTHGVMPTAFCLAR